MSKYPPMDSMSCWPQWAIPGVGPLWPCFDRVQIVSSESVGALKARLPVAQLQRACHSFNVVRYKGPDPQLQSSIVVVGTRTANSWPILARHETDLGRYSITRAEIAFDVEAASIDAARDGLFTLVRQLGKRRHQRSYISSVHKPDGTPPAGCVAEPTYYLEDRKGSVGLKSYVRYQKQPGGGFGGLCVRLEWTLTGKRALKRHLGGTRPGTIVAARRPGIRQSGINGTTRITARKGQPSCSCAFLRSVRPTNSVTRVPRGARAGTHRRRSGAI
jgi:hypothetical protein